MADIIDLVGVQQTFRAPTEAQVRAAVFAAAEEAGDDLTKAFLNDYKQIEEAVHKAA